jgi:hypothetical protein
MTPFRFFIMRNLSSLDNLWFPFVDGEPLNIGLYPAKT